MDFLPRPRSHRKPEEGGVSLAQSEEFCLCQAAAREPRSIRRPTFGNLQILSRPFECACRAPAQLQRIVKCPPSGGQVAATSRPGEPKRGSALLGRAENMKIDPRHWSCWPALLLGVNSLSSGCGSGRAIGHCFCVRAFTCSSGRSIGRPL